MRIFSEETANKIYDILVEHAGAIEDERFSFVLSHSIDKNLDLFREWRFRGKLGPGGKFWNRKYKISCYPEDETPERLEIIKKVNSLLEEIKKGE